MSIRLAHVEDAPAMARVMVDTYLAAHRDQMPEAAWQKRKQEWTYVVSEQGWARTITDIANGSSQLCVYVATTEADEVVGLVVGYPTESDAQTGEISALYVRQDHQGTTRPLRVALNGNFDRNLGSSGRLRFGWRRPWCR